ncbi:hypothetical protein GCM10010341_67270 [Streptomyces noursei]|nr:hypothetical protein GCM10010341_67270 [Streptomyces noursei]
MLVEVFQEPNGVVAGGEDPGLGLGGILAQANRAAVAAPPVLVDQVVQQVRGGAGDFLQRGTDRLGDQFQPGQVTHGGQDVGGVGALRGALAHQPGFLQAGQREVEEAIGAVALGETVAEIGQHTVVEAGVVQLHGHRVLEVDPAAHRLGGLPVRQAEQELQHADGGQLGGREARTPVTRIPVRKVLVTPQPVQAVSHPHRCRTTWVARPRDLRRQRRDLLAGTRTERQRTPRQLHGLSEHPEHAHRSPQLTGKLQDPRQNQAEPAAEFCGLLGVEESGAMGVGLQQGEVVDGHEPEWPGRLRA